MSAVLKKLNFSMAYTPVEGCKVGGNSVNCQIGLACMWKVRVPNCIVTSKWRLPVLVSVQI